MWQSGHHFWLAFFKLPCCGVACRDSSGKLGRPVSTQGNVKLLQTKVFTAGQSKPCLHTDIHSIRCNHGDAPVTLVIRHKGQVAKGRLATFYLFDAETGNEGGSSGGMWSQWQDDRPCSYTEKSSMLKVNTFMNC